MVENLKELLSMDLRKVEENLFILMEHIMRETLKMTRWKDREPCFMVLIDPLIRDNGLLTNSMDLEFYTTKILSI